MRGVKKDFPITRPFKLARNFFRRPALLFVFALATCIFSVSAKAEYRTFRLQIKDQVSGASRTVITNLDNVQYPGYYQIKKNEVVTIAATWMCWGRTDSFQPYCPEPPPKGATNPPAQAPSAAPRR